MTFQNALQGDHSKKNIGQETKDKDNAPFVSVIVPCRNEVEYISMFLESVVNIEYPRDRLEVLVIDGMSTDGTREILNRYQKEFNFVRILDNTLRFTPQALNLGIKTARGEIVIRMDVHACYQKDYIQKCVKYLMECDADNVGGTIITSASKNTLTAKGIACALSSIFGAGRSYFRIGSKRPRYVDTVFGGCYRRELFEAVGLFNENLKRCQDIEFNLRLKRRGYKTLLIPEIKAFYFPSSNLSNFIKHKFVDGIWALKSFCYTNAMPVTIRSLLPLMFVIVLGSLLILGTIKSLFFNLFLILITIYLFINLIFSFDIALKHRNIRLLISNFVSFCALHFSYGLGSLTGLLCLLKCRIESLVSRGK